MTYIEEAKQLYSKLCDNCNKKEYKLWCSKCKTNVASIKMINPVFAKFEKLLKN